MAHPLSLSATQKNTLLNPGVPEIKANVTLTGKRKTVSSENSDGSLNVTSTLVDGDIVLTEGVVNNKVVISEEIPILPTGSGAFDPQGEVTIAIDNTKKYYSTMQDGAIIDPDTIEDSEITITASAGSMTALNMFKGKVIRQPTEESERTIIDIRSSLWDILNIELHPELKKGGSGAISTSFSIDSGGVVSETTDDDNSLDITYHNALGLFDEAGNIRVGASNTDPSKITILQIELQATSDNFCPLGKFEIEFINASEFKVIQPNYETHTGNISATFNQGFVKILPDYWNRIKQTDEDGNIITDSKGAVVYHDPTGVKIEFYSFYTARGNPISIVKNLLYKGLAQDWGDMFTEDSSLDVDWTTFNKFENIFNWVEIHLTETNKNNRVFDPQNKERPIRIREVCQKILEHIGCNLICKPNGAISIVSTFFKEDDTALYQITSDNTIRHKIFSDSPKYDYLRVRYGYDIIQDTYGGTIIKFDTAKTYYKNISEISFPYFKTVKNTVEATSFADLFWGKVKSAHKRLEMEVMPGWGLPFNAGDKTEVSLSVQPILPNTDDNRGQYWEVYNIRKEIGGKVLLQCVEISNPVDSVEVCGVANVCTETF